MSLYDIPEDEARALLARRYVCEDYGDWASAAAAPEAYLLTCGLLDPDLARTPFYIELYVKISQKTRLAHYRFSMLRRRPLAARIYQLEIRTSPHSLRDRHQRPHEHIGNLLICGHTTWIDWGFNDVLARFVGQTKIEFRPDLESPLDFRLRPS